MPTPRPSARPAEHGGSPPLTGRDPDAFRDVYRHHAEQIHGYFLRRTRSDSAAQDLTAETFAQAWFSIGKGRGPEGYDSPTPWLYGIARNVLLMSIRRGALEQRASERLGLRERLDRPGFAADHQPGPSWLDGADELLDALPPSQREAVRLRVVDDLDYDEVASRLAISEPAARVRVHRGLRALRGALSPSKQQDQR